MGIKGPLGISLTNTEQTHCFLCKVGLLHLPSPVFTPEKKLARQHRHSSFSKRKKNHPHFFHLEIQADLEVFPTHYPYHSLFSNAAEEQWKNISRPVSSPSLNSATYKLRDFGQVTKCLWRFGSHLYLPPLARCNVE